MHQILRHHYQNTELNLTIFVLCLFFGIRQNICFTNIWCLRVVRIPCMLCHCLCRTVGPGSSSGTGHVGHISHSGAQCTLGDPPWGLRRNLSVDILFVIQKLFTLYFQSMVNNHCMSPIEKLTHRYLKFPLMLRLGDIKAGQRSTWNQFLWSLIVSASTDRIIPLHCECRRCNWAMFVQWSHAMLCSAPKCWLTWYRGTRQPDQSILIFTSIG